MIRLFHVHFPARMVALVVTESLLACGTLVLVTLLWFGRDLELAFSFDYGLARIGVACLACMLCMYYYDLYDSSILYVRRQNLVRLIQVLGTVCIVLALVYFAYPALQLERGPLLVWILATGVLLAVWRPAFLALTSSTSLSHRALLLGGGAAASALVAEIAPRSELGLHLAGYVDSPAGETDDSPPVPRLGAIDELREVVRHHRITHIVLTMSDRRGRLPVETLLNLKASGVRIEDALDVYEAVTGRVSVESLRPSWLLFSEGFRVSRWVSLSRSAISAFAAGLGLLLCLPLLAAVAAAIRLESRGPAIFRQRRIGKNGRPFTLYKFRSMTEDADPVLPAAEDDPRITRLGRWLRRTRLDEIPQLYNILRGDMWLVGPRPFTPQAEEECARQIPFYGQRWNVKPGITGWAQIHNGYCATLQDNIDKLGYDLFYIKNISLALDLLILFYTTKILLLGRGAR